MILGAFCFAAFVLALIGALQLVREQRAFKTKLARLEETQRSIDPQRLSAATSRITRDVESATALLERARRALATIGVASRYVAVAIRVVKLLT